MKREQVQRFLRTPRGMLALLLASLAVSAAAALGAASRRDWFEAHVRERYPAVTSELHAVGTGLGGGREAIAIVRSLDAAKQRGLYAAWMVEGGRWPAAAPRAMLAASPRVFLDCAEATLVAGSAAQRARAARFLAASDLPAARALLTHELRRARARGDRELTSFLSHHLSLNDERTLP